MLTASALLLTTGCSGSKWQDGDYKTSGKGIHGPVNVTVAIQEGKLSSVEVTGHNETPGIGTKAIETIPGAVIEAQGIEGVDDVSGATVTSQAIKEAVTEALDIASGNK